MDAPEDNILIREEVASVCIAHLVLFRLKRMPRFAELVHQDPIQTVLDKQHVHHVELDHMHPRLVVVNVLHVQSILFRHDLQPFVWNVKWEAKLLVIKASVCPALPDTFVRLHIHNVNAVQWQPMPTRCKMNVNLVMWSKASYAQRVRWRCKKVIGLI